MAQQQVAGLIGVLDGLAVEACDLRKGWFSMRQKQQFPIARLQQLLDKHNFAQRQKAIEDERCEADLLYALFRRTKTVLPKLLPGLLEVVTRKNAPDMEESRMYRDARDYLLNADKHADRHVCIFMVMTIVNHDTETHAVFRDGYADGNFFGTAAQGYAQFQRWLPHLAQLVEGMKMASVGEANVLHAVFEFVVACEYYYLSK